MRVAFLVGVALLTMARGGAAQWSVETRQDPITGREFTRAVLSEFGGRAALIVRCVRDEAEPIIYLHDPANGTHVPVIYRFDDGQPQTRMATALQDGHVLQLWKEEDKQQFANARRLRIQIRPFVVFDFDLRGTEALLPKLNCG
jgi:hypothetical protein